MNLRFLVACLSKTIELKESFACIGPCDEAVGVEEAAGEAAQVKLRGPQVHIQTLCQVRICLGSFSLFNEQISKVALQWYLTIKMIRYLKNCPARYLIVKNHILIYNRASVALTQLLNHTCDHDTASSSLLVLYFYTVWRSA